MTRLTNSANGHQISTDDASVKFWEAAGYRADKPKPEPKPAPKKSSK